MSDNKKAQNINIKNKVASFEYFLLEEYVAGIVLTGTEIKSVRESKVSLAEAYCAFVKDELFIRNMHIAEYKYGTYANHEPKRDRKLLLNRKELRKIFTKTKEKGLTIIPVKLFVNDKGLAKIVIAVAKGKKLYDKRETLKTKDLKREMDRSGY
ncbi:MAG: SsrA-binding protein SmpB [Bacteroidetes bacterium]|nr:SsrA-binding protein SmpB [Bacteroidota bacterium]